MVRRRTMKIKLKNVKGGIFGFNVSENLKNLISRLSLNSNNSSSTPDVSESPMTITDPDPKSVQHREGARFNEFKDTMIYYANQISDETKKRKEFEKMVEPGYIEGQYDEMLKKEKEAIAVGDDERDAYNMMKSTLIRRIEVNDDLKSKIKSSNLDKLKNSLVPLDVIENAIKLNDDDLAKLINNDIYYFKLPRHILPSGGGQKTRRRRNKSRMNRKSRR